MNNNEKNVDDFKYNASVYQNDLQSQYLINYLTATVAQSVRAFESQTPQT